VTSPRGLVRRKPSYRLWNEDRGRESAPARSMSRARPFARARVSGNGCAQAHVVGGAGGHAVGAPHEVWAPCVLPEVCRVRERGDDASPKAR
jgi:hypothetical protein